MAGFEGNKNIVPGMWRIYQAAQWTEGTPSSRAVAQRLDLGDSVAASGTTEGKVRAFFVKDGARWYGFPPGTPAVGMALSHYYEAGEARFKVGWAAIGLTDEGLEAISDLWPEVEQLIEERTKAKAAQEKAEREAQAAAKKRTAGESARIGAYVQRKIAQIPPYVPVLQVVRPGDTIDSSGGRRAATFQLLRIGWKVDFEKLHGALPEGWELGMVLIQVPTGKVDTWTGKPAVQTYAQIVPEVAALGLVVVRGPGGFRPPLADEIRPFIGQADQINKDAEQMARGAYQGAVNAIRLQATRTDAGRLLAPAPATYVPVQLPDGGQSGYWQLNDRILNRAFTYSGGSGDGGGGLGGRQDRAP